MPVLNDTVHVNTINSKTNYNQIMNRVEIVKPRRPVYDPCHVRRS